MAFQEQPRENLLRDATQFPRRLLLKCEGIDASELTAALQGLPAFGDQATTPGEIEVFLGQRAGGSWSVYVEEDPVLQFNAGDELRRAFIQAEKYAAEGGRLVRLTRGQLGGRVRLQNIPLDDRSHGLLTTACIDLIDWLVATWELGRLEIAGSVPAEDRTLASEAQQFLQRLSQSFTIADAPNA